MKIIGINSGTSIDGVDLVYVEYYEEDSITKERLICFDEMKYTISFKDKLEKLLNPDLATLRDVCSMNFEISRVYAGYIDQFILKNQIDKTQIDFIASHGQTVWHNPLESEEYVKSTLQLGDIGVLAYLTKLSVIGNFRTRDMAANGEGAPLMPIYDYYRYANLNKNLAIINLGGISNVTYIKKGAEREELIAFDMGPANILVDKSCLKFYNIPYDDSGKIARKGKLDLGLLQFLKEDEYLKKKYPKSTGREKYSDQYFEEILTHFTSRDYCDLVFTLTYYTAYCIQVSLRFLGEIDCIYLSGGGALNDFLVEMIEELTQKTIYIDSDYKIKEAKLFAYLGYLFQINKPGNIMSVTNASENVILGTYAKGEGNDKN